MPTPLNISASRAGAILGMSNYSTPLQVWLQIIKSREPGFCEKNNYKLPEFEYNSAMRWGHAFESAVIELAENKVDNDIIEREKLFTGKNIIVPQKHKYFNFEYLYPKPLDFLTCHVDGIYSGDGNTLHEGKTTSAQYFYSAFGEPGTDRVPVEYQLQCQHQMICTGAEKVILSVLVFPKRVEEWEEMGLDPDNKYITLPEKNGCTIIETVEFAKMLDYMGYFHQFTITAHADLQKLMIEAYSDFWNNHVLTGIPPEPKNYDDIKSICREPVGTIIATPEIEYLISEHSLIGKEISTTGTLAKRRDQLKTEILNWSRSAGFVEDDDSKDKWIIRDSHGKKIASYGKTEKGVYIFR